MKKHVLLISSAYTGNGHQSITEALCEQFSKLGATVSVLEGFDLLGRPGVKISKAYGPVTRTSKEAWRMLWELVQTSPNSINRTMAPIMSHKLMEVIEREQPDIIVSVHPMFVGSVVRILKRKNVDIPFISIFADLVSISGLWPDARADYNLCYTDEAEEFARGCGVPQDKIKRFSFPVRERFTAGAPVAGSQRYKASRIPTFLVMSGGEGSGNLILLTRMLLNNFNCRVKVVAGRNERILRRLLHKEKPRYGDRLEVFGFTRAIEEQMLASDLAFMRGSPNTIMEAVNCCLPVIITDALPGQEEGNPSYFESHGLACFADRLPLIGNTVRELLANNGEKLAIIKENQKSFRNTDAAKEIAEFVLSVAK
ncbi:MAG: UDP-N-acetylglucosamine--LPS N-acetylglucosamine transferase [Clostridia bacterium]|nr:UDP-N-acetylglucosamine--LPS N-acetylglucosamine transferase [Clostridia bacterium]